MKIRKVNELNDTPLLDKEEIKSDLELLKKANILLRQYRDTPVWNNIIEFLNERDIDYFNWNDSQVLEYYLQAQLDG